jgi:multidrug efflux pump subunit AcrA (membrane-fusion protein)
MEQLAAQQLERARDLQRKKSISEELLDQRRTDLAAARAETSVRTGQRRLAEIDVQNCELVAPFDGIITARNGSVGSYIGRGSIIVTMTERSGSEVSAQLRPPQAVSLAAANAPVFRHDEQRYPVTLRAIVEQVDPTTRTREARLVFAAADALPGLAGRLSWQTGRKLLPADMITRRDGQLGVFVLDGGKARFRVLAGAESGRPAVVRLGQDTLIIDGGRQRLSDGADVTLTGMTQRE